MPALYDFIYSPINSDIVSFIVLWNNIIMCSRDLDKLGLFFQLSRVGSQGLEQPLVVSASSFLLAWLSFSNDCSASGIMHLFPSEEKKKQEEATSLSSQRCPIDPMESSGQADMTLGKGGF